MDAGARAKRMLARKIHAKYVSGSTENVPDDIAETKGYQPEIEHSKLGDAKKKADKKRESKLPPHLQGDAIGKMRKAFSQEGYRVLAKGDDGKRAQFSYKDEKEAKKFASTFKKATVTKEDYYSGTGEKVAARTKKYMEKKGMKGAPGLDAMKARTAEHKAKRGVKEEIVTEADPRLAIYQSGMTDASRVKGRVGKAVDKVKDKVKKVLGKKDKVSSHLDRYRFQSGMDNYLKSKVKKEEVELDEGKKKGLWDNIHAKRKRGEKPAKPGDKDYPKTLNVEGIKQARKNVGADKCWDGYKAKGTKKKGGKEVPNCVKEEDKAFNYVVAKLKKQHGDGVLTKRDKIKPQSPAEKAKVRAHQAKVDKENAAERAKDPSQGRYPKGYSNRGSD